MRRGGFWVWIVLAVALAIPLMALFGSARLGRRRQTKPAAAAAARGNPQPRAPFMRPADGTQIITPPAKTLLASRSIPGAGAISRGVVPGAPSSPLVPRPASPPLAAPPSAAFGVPQAAAAATSGSPIARPAAMGASMPARIGINTAAPPTSDTPPIIRDPMLSPEDIEALKPKPKVVKHRPKPKVKRVDFAAMLRNLLASVELQAIITKGAASKAIIDGDTVDVGSVIRVKKQTLKIVKITGEGVVFSWKNHRAIKAWKGGLE